MLKNIYKNSPFFKIDGKTTFNSVGSIGVPNTGGIYFISDFRGVLYIGKTENLNRRFKDHYWNTQNPRIAQVKKNPIGQLEFSWMYVDFKDQTDKEKELIQYFQPVCNHMLVNKGAI